MSGLNNYSFYFPFVKSLFMGTLTSQDSKNEDGLEAIGLTKSVEWRKLFESNKRGSAKPFLFFYFLNSWATLEWKVQIFCLYQNKHILL